MDNPGQYGEVAITFQPGPGTAGTGFGAVPDDWLPPPSSERVPTNCPPGLEHFAAMDEIYIYQQINWKEIIFGCEWNQKYIVTDPSSGKKIYKTSEDTPFCTRFWCKNARALEMSVLDHADKEVLHLSRPFHCASGGIGCPPCMDEFNISTPGGQLLGSVRQIFTCWNPRFNVFDANGELVFDIKGPCCHLKCCGEVPFQIYSPRETTEVGVIAKMWTGTAKECCTDVDNFRIAFPPKLDVRLKACLFGACMSIDMLFFENQHQ